MWLVGAHHLNEAEQPTAHLLLLEALAPIPNEARIEVGLSELEQLATVHRVRRAAYLLRARGRGKVKVRVGVRVRG